ncbi:hypothetical protein [Streptomyces sp. NPDC052225]|uniref:hypothetical protein n=1 Tax=Streptomyces sp. NPDC052225 TaxID=3154949 RepID=UPI00342E12C9
MGGTAAAGAVTLAMALVVGGCSAGEPVPEGLVLKASGAPPAPYDGPLKAKTPSWIGEDSPLEGGGAAVRALECAGKPMQAGTGGDWGSGDGAYGAPDQALAAYVGDQFWRILPERGYRAERRTKSRVLYSYDVGGRTRAAVIVVKDRRKKPGWDMETFAMCDPSEFRAKERAGLEMRVWEDRRGRPVSTSLVESSMGPEHCDWQSVEFLYLDRAKDPHDRGAQYLRDPDGQLTDFEGLVSSYARDVPLPADAVDTGYRHDGRELWLARDRSVAYVKTDGRVERWPGTKEPVACM